MLINPLTTARTIPGLCSRSARTVWNTSTIPSVLSLSRRMLTAIKVPVRPVPPLQWATIGLSPELLCHFCTWPMRSMNPDPLSGTPSSGHPVYWKCFTGRLDPSYYAMGKGVRRQSSICQNNRSGLPKITTYSCVHNFELSEYIVWVLVDCMKDHLEVGKTGCPTLRPVAMTLGLPPFPLLGEHHNGGTVLLPNHPPEVIRCVWKRSLCGYEGITLVVALYIEYEIVARSYKIACTCLH